jgi:hypothetical protein
VTNGLKTYHGSHELKAEFVARMQAHIAADEVMQGTGFERGRGCAVGCTYDEYDHALGPVRLGFPQWYEHWRDVVFEGLPENEAPAWALASLAAVPVGVDLEPIRWHLAIARHERDLQLMGSEKGDYASQCRSAITRVIAYCKSQLEGQATDHERSAAESAAESEAESAVRSAWQFERDTFLRLIARVGA